MNAKTIVLVVLKAAVLSAWCFATEMLFGTEINEYWYEITKIPIFRYSELFSEMEPAVKTIWYAALSTLSGTCLTGALYLLSTSKRRT